MGWNFGDILDGIEAVLPADAPGLVHADRRIGWGEFSELSNRLAAALVAHGARPGDKFAFYLHNCSEYLIALSACFKARLVHVNVNYHYRGEELHYILDDSDARFVLFESVFGDRMAKLVPRLPEVTRWIQVGGAAAPFATALESLFAEGDAVPLGVPRSSDDLLLVYTGGTTGWPKGAMWRAEDLWAALGAGGTIRANAGQLPLTVADHVANVKRFGPGPVQIPVCPLMHATGLFTSILNLLGGGCSVTLAQNRFDPEALFDAVERERANSLVIVGDVFAKPMLRTLDAHPGRWDLNSLQIIISSGSMWSEEVKRGLLKHHAGMVLADMFSSSEAIGFGTSVSSAAGDSGTAKFRIGDDCKVFTEDHREVAPGSGERGFIARPGPIPLGYYKDPEKTAETFPTIGGVRYSVPGDWCTVESDGTLTLLGRSSMCINSGGEKVYAEEVEESLKTHADVEDALVVGVPDARWGRAVTALVMLREGAALDEGGLRRHVRAQLAGYKTPKRILAVQGMFRAPNGKADYARATAHARRALGIA